MRQLGHTVVLISGMMSDGNYLLSYFDVCVQGLVRLTADSKLPVSFNVSVNVLQPPSNPFNTEIAISIIFKSKVPCYAHVQVQCGVSTRKNILIQPNVAAPLFSLCLNALCWCLSL